MVATAEMIPIEPEEDKYKVTIVGNQRHEDIDGEVYSGIWIEETDGLESIGMEGGGEFPMINAEEGYDIVIEENQYDQAEITTVEL